MKTLKSSKLYAILFVIFLLFISSCAKNKNINEDVEFKVVCQDADYEWMLMKPTQDDKFIKNSEECWGCMVEGIEHICDKEKFKEYTTK